MRWILHVDLDQFLAAVEVLRRPDLAGRPVVVAGDGDPTKRGVVSTASYEARAFGVHSGMPLRLAARKCPDAVFLPVDKAHYEAVSAEVMATLRATGAPVEVLGWDEAYLAADTDDPEAFARRIQQDVLAATGLHCSVGIGENRLQAKLATDFGKPAGVYRLTGATWFEVFGERPTDALWGIGTKTARKLAAHGIETVAQLAATDPRELAVVFGPATGPWLVALGRGRSGGEVTETPWVPRSRSKEVTYQEDLADWAQVEREVARLAREVAAETQGRPSQRVVVKVRYQPFFTSTHGAAVKPPGDNAETLATAALEALGRFTDRRPVRLLGVRAEFAAPES